MRMRGPPAHEGGQKQTVMSSGQYMRQCMWGGHGFSIAIFDDSRAAVSSDFFLHQTLTRHLTAPQTSIFSLEKPWYPHMHCHVNWTELTSACYAPPSSTRAHACAHTLLASLDVSLRYPKAAFSFLTCLIVGTLGKFSFKYPLIITNLT